MFKEVGPVWIGTLPFHEHTPTSKAEWCSPSLNTAPLFNSASTSCVTFFSCSFNPKTLPLHPPIVPHPSSST
ncbi:hypothetical protein JOQ06_010071 [Pogonophryne albipinna]|uniref:Uncharacterized protein n=1 Tax=Pogonophryne albipinna TaxID=1090488 RepID=A0AAD6FF73_9TELE|nr:hypothetical protein JOQ06_010071 [Pogonophryne albipinna]